MTELRWQLTRAQAACLAFAFLFGAAFIALFVQQRAHADLDNIDPYAEGGWYEVESTPAGLVRWNVRTGDSWVLACPGPDKRSCTWDPIDFRGDPPQPDGPGVYEVEADDDRAVLFSIRTGRSWVLACPGAVRTCDWEPLEVRDPEE